MKLIGEIKGKEVLDSNGNLIGTVDDFEWDENNFKIKNFVILEKGVGSKLGMGKDLFLPVENIKTIGEKVLTDK